MSSLTILFPLSVYSPGPHTLDCTAHLIPTTLTVNNMAVYGEGVIDAYQFFQEGNER